MSRDGGPADLEEEEVIIEEIPPEEDEENVSSNKNPLNTPASLKIK